MLLFSDVYANLVNYANTSGGSIKGSPLVLFWVAVIQQQTGRGIGMIGNRRDKGLNEQQQTGRGIGMIGNRQDEGRVRTVQAVTALTTAFTDSFRHVIKLQALASLYRQSFVVMLPRGEDEQLTMGTGIHALAARFRQVGETVFL